MPCREASEGLAPDCDGLSVPVGQPAPNQPAHAVAHVAVLDGCHFRCLNQPSAGVRHALVTQFPVARGELLNLRKTMVSQDPPQRSSDKPRGRLVTPQHPHPFNPQRARCRARSPSGRSGLPSHAPCYRAECADASGHQYRRGRPPIRGRSRAVRLPESPSGGVPSLVGDDRDQPALLIAVGTDHEFSRRAIDFISSVVEVE